MKKLMIICLLLTGCTTFTVTDGDMKMSYLRVGTMEMKEMKVDRSDLIDNGVRTKLEIGSMNLNDKSDIIINKLDSIIAELAELYGVQ